MPLFYTKILFRMNGELSRSLICRIRPTSSLFSFMAEISPHQGTKSQWIEALLFLPISEILSLTWEIVVDPAYTFLGIETFYNFH